MSTLAQDRLFIEEAIPQLGDYLLSKEIFWPLGGTLPRLTLGSLLLALARVGDAASSARCEPVRMRWPAAWESKAAQELRSRLRLWENFLKDHAASPYEQDGRYAQEVRNRAMIQLLAGELRQPPPELVLLSELDRKLKVSLIHGHFIWEAEIESHFPEHEFWFLYGTLQSR